jgi:hypothetical protein
VPAAEPYEVGVCSEMSGLSPGRFPYNEWGPPIRYARRRSSDMVLSYLDDCCEVVDESVPGRATSSIHG